MDDADLCALDKTILKVHPIEPFLFSLYCPGYFTKYTKRFQTEDDDVYLPTGFARYLVRDGGICVCLPCFFWKMFCYAAIHGRHGIA